MDLARELLASIVGALRADPTLAKELRQLLSPPTESTGQDPEPLYLSVPDFCRRYSFSRTFVELQLRAGMPLVGKRRARRIPVQPALEWLNAQGHEQRPAKVAVTGRSRAALLAARMAAEP